MAVRVRRTRWQDGATEEEIREAAAGEESKDVSKLISLLCTYFKFPSEMSDLQEEAEKFAEKEDMTPAEACDMYLKLCFFREEDVISKMEVGDAVFVKCRLFWVNPVQEAAYIFEYEDSDSDQ